LVTGRQNPEGKIVVGIDDDRLDRTRRAKWLLREKRPANKSAKKSSGWPSYWPGICSVCSTRFPKGTRIVTVAERTDDQPTLYRHAGCVPLEPLTADEAALLAKCEAVIEDGLQMATKGVVGAGKALKVVRDKRLYRATDGTFAAYCQRCRDLTPQHVNRLISAYEISAILEPAGSIPHERQLRELTPLRDRPERMRSVWEQAVAASGGRLPPAPVVRQFVQQATNPTVVSGKADRVDDTPTTPAQESVRASLFYQPAPEPMTRRRSLPNRRHPHSRTSRSSSRRLLHRRRQNRRSSHWPSGSIPTRSSSGA
jgi:hypothetical protein